jgi:hypothetical protein
MARTYASVVLFASLSVVGAWFGWHQSLAESKSGSQAELIGAWRTVSAGYHYANGGCDSCCVEYWFYCCPNGNQNNCGIGNCGNNQACKYDETLGDYYCPTVRAVKLNWHSDVYLETNCGATGSTFPEVNAIPVGFCAWQDPEIEVKCFRTALCQCVNNGLGGKICHTPKLSPTFTADASWGDGGYNPYCYFD